MVRRPRPAGNSYADKASVRSGRAVSFWRFSRLPAAQSNDSLPSMKTTTLTVSSKGQTLMPLDWRKRNDLARGGSCNAFYLEDGALLIVPVRPPGKERLRTLLASVKPVKPPADWKERAERALEVVRR